MSAIQIPTPDEVKAARVAAGLTQTAAADLVHRTLRNWQQWESGARRIDLALWDLFQLKVNLWIAHRYPSEASGSRQERNHENPEKRSANRWLHH
jgi:hypothetical protein